MEKEQTLIIIKPDGVQRSLIGEIIRRYERMGLKLVALKLVMPTKELVERHYLSLPAWLENVGRKITKACLAKGKKPPSDDLVECGKEVLKRNVNFLTSGPVVAMVWEGNEAAGIVKKITGPTEPLSSDVGTIRGDLTVDSYGLAEDGERAVRNLIHVSGTPEEAQKEIPVWFSPKEILKYRLIQERILYDVNLDGIKE